MLLLAIAQEANRSGACSLTQERLADRCRCSVRQVRRMLKQLADERYLGRGSRRGALGGGRTSDLYVLPREAREGKSDTQMSALVEYGEQTGHLIPAVSGCSKERRGCWISTAHMRSTIFQACFCG